MRRSDFKPGMLVKNKVSGNTAVVRDDGKGKLIPLHKDYLAVRLHPTVTTRYQYPFWHVENVEMTR